MKALYYISVLATLLTSSCATTGLYMGGESDDLYYSPSDQPVASTRNNIVDQNITRNNEPQQYYDNAYANDTLYADKYNNEVDFNNSQYYSNGDNPFEYMDDWSYSNRLRRFYGNYFDPYWRDPLYYPFGYSSFGLGFNYGFGSPYFGGFSLGFGSPFYSGFYDPFLYGGFYGGYYGGFYGGYYGSFYNPYYWGGYGYYPGYWTNNGENVSTGVGRRARYSTLSNNYNSLGPSRKGTNSGITSGGSRRSASGTQGITTDSRRSGSNLTNSRLNASANTSSSQVAQTRRDASNISNSASSSSRPQYNSVNRSYTPSYYNPRMSTRPSYNNSRISGGTNNSAVQNNTRVYNYRSGQGSINRVERANSYGGQSRTITSPSRSGGYTPSRSSGSSSGYSGGSYNSSSGVGRSSSSSYSGGSSSSGSRGSSGSSGGHGRR